MSALSTYMLRKWLCDSTDYTTRRSVLDTWGLCRKRRLEFRLRLSPMGFTCKWIATNLCADKRLAISCHNGPLSVRRAMAMMAACVNNLADAKPSSTSRDITRGVVPASYLAVSRGAEFEIL